jgi:hypothetical protein
MMKLMSVDVRSYSRFSGLLGKQFFAGNGKFLFPFFPDTEN